MLMLVEKGIKGGMCYAIQKYAKSNNNSMKNYDANIESSYLLYLYANNVCRWATSQKLPINGFKWEKSI